MCEPTTMRERWNGGTDGAVARAAVTSAISGRSGDVVRLLDEATAAELRNGMTMLVATVKTLIERMATEAGGDPSDAERLWQVFATTYVQSNGGSD